MGIASTERWEKPIRALGDPAAFIAVLDHRRPTYVGGSAVIGFQLCRRTRKVREMTWVRR